MRTIKFRAKAKGSPLIQDGTFVYGSLVLRNENMPVIDIHGYVDGFGVHYKHTVDKDTIGQFTGLYDKNGKEIYEGDILKYTRYNFKTEYLKEEKIEEIYVVFWNESKHAFYCRTKLKNGGGASGFLNFEDERAEKNEIEVVGNRFDNPELLKGGQE